jgi:hypothetical protein
VEKQLKMDVGSRITTQLAKDRCRIVLGIDSRLPVNRYLELDAVTDA